MMNSRRPDWMAAVFRFLNVFDDCRPGRSLQPLSPTFTTLRRNRLRCGQIQLDAAQFAGISRNAEEVEGRITEAGRWCSHHPAGG